MAESGSSQGRPQDVPFPESLCHRCAAPIKQIRTERSTFLHCPILKRYPPQPVWSCEAFLPKEETKGLPGNS